MATIRTEISVGVTDEILEAVEMAVEFIGIKASTFGRIALVEKLAREGFLEQPTRRTKSAAAIIPAAVA
jgi:hypothetical protein